MKKIISVLMPILAIFFLVGGTYYYLNAGNKNFSEGDSPHTAWVGGSNGFRRGVSEKELDRLRPEAAVYGGGGRFAGEDKDVFYLCNCPVAYTESEGMAELIWEKDGWRLLQERIASGTSF